MSSGRIRQGGVFVEIGADARQFFATLNKVNKQIGKLGSAMAGAGSKMMGIGAGLAAPIGAAVVAGAKFQDVMLNVRASTGATAGELDQVRKAAMDMSQALGVGPTEAASGMLELLKAGMSVEQVLGGAGKAALTFAKVGGMSTADAAVVMADAMNVFKVSASVAANALSSAADASSTSIEGIAQAFSQVSAVAGLANQSIQDTSAALAVLANAGVKGSDAGTSLKTMLLRIMAPANEAVGALQEIGLSVRSFRNADGTMKPMVEIIRTLTTAMQGMDQAAKDDIFRRVFGQDAIRAAAVMTSAGVDGFSAMRDGMAGAMSVGDKYATMQSGLSGAASALRAAMERLAIAVSDAVGPAFMSIAEAVGPLIDGFTKFVSTNKELVGQVAKGIAIFTASGAGLFVLGKAIAFASGSFGSLLGVAGGVFSALKTVSGGAIGLAASFLRAVAGVLAYTAASIASAAASGAAWVAANAPLLALLGILGGIGAMAVNAMGGLQGIATAVSGGLTTAVGDAVTVFGDLAKTAQSTFSGVYEAIAAGDLSGAMDILWAGMQAGWLRGVEALMSYVDPWISLFQNTFTYLGTGIATTWEAMWSGLVQGANTIGAVVMGVVDNLVNGVMAAFDAMVATVRKSWNYVQSFITKGYDLAKENEKVDSEMSARAREREVSRPGVAGRVAQAQKDNAKTAKEAQGRIDAMNADANATAQGRLDRNGQLAEERRAATQAAEGRVEGLTRTQRERRTLRGQADDVMSQLDKATTMDQVRELADEFHTLAATGHLTEEQMKKFAEVAGNAQDRIEEAKGEMGAAAAAPVDPEQLRKAAADAAASQSEVAGTFSAQAVSGMGYGKSLAEKQLDELRGIHEEVKKDNAPRAAA